MVMLVLPLLLSLFILSLLLLLLLLLLVLEGVVGVVEGWWLKREERAWCGGLLAILFE